MLKYKPSVLAACMLFLGFQLQFEINLKDYELVSPAGKRKVSEICDIFRLWYKVLELALEVADVPKIVDFCEMLFDRQISLHEEYRDQFKNIYRERVREYFKKAPKRVVTAAPIFDAKQSQHQSRT
mmetsp:Transcript_31934/g.42281  ORF Transcript_31934/g.42281 Transcript_31934/m.42281 type:complete len:126 (-) Transcript_31934:695-1072(-)